MYSILKIGDKEYKLEFSFEASMYSDCVSSVMKILSGMSESDAESVISSMADLPKTAVTLLYAGLLEHHGYEGDRAVPDKRTAKALAKQWILEQGEEGNFYALMKLCIDQMGEDGFFKLTGLEDMMSPTEDEEEKPVPKTPQDHKKKTRKATEK